MSATDGRERDAGGLEEYPEFAISYLFDDREDPSEVTVFPSSDEYDISTHWITVDAENAVPLEDAR